MNKWQWTILLAVILIAFLLTKTLYVAGSFKTIHPHLEGTISKIYTNVPGPEDMDSDESRGWLFISSSDRWRTMRGEDPSDGIYFLHPDSAGSPVKLGTAWSGAFHPHGISFFRHRDKTLLFAVNHNRQGNFVEVFDFRRDSLFHIQSIAGEMMCCPNDVVAVDEDKFYVTNDHGAREGVLRTLEDYLLIPRASLLYFDGKSFSKAVENLKYANGVNISADGKKLYLTQTTGQTLMTFDRDMETGRLQLANALNLHTGLDNVSSDRDGNLWIGAHPKMLDFVEHAKDSSRKSPSQVLKVTVDPSTGSYAVTEIYLNDGVELSGSSVAIRYKNDLFVGVVFQNRILRLRVN